MLAGLRGHGRGLLATAAGQVPLNLPQTYSLPDYELADLSLTTLLEQNATLLGEKHPNLADELRQRAKILETIL